MVKTKMRTKISVFFQINRIPRDFIPTINSTLATYRRANVIFFSCSIFHALLTTNPFSELLELRQTSLGDVWWLWNRAILRLLLPTPGLGNRRPSRNLQQSSASRTSKIGVSKSSQNRKRSSVERERGKYRRAYTGQWYDQGEVTLRRELLSTQTIR